MWLAVVVLLGFPTLMYVVWLGALLLRYRQFGGPSILSNLLALERALTYPLPLIYEELARKYGKLFRFLIGARPVLIISDADLMREATVKKYKDFEDRPVPMIVSRARRHAVAAGIFVAKAELWSHLRAASMPLFHSKSLSGYAKLMNQAADVLVARVAAAAESGCPVNLCDAIGDMTMRVTFQCAFGVDVPPQADGSPHPGVVAANEVFRNAFTGWWLVLLMSVPEFAKPWVQDLALALGYSPEVDRGRDVLFSITDQLCRSYCQAHNLPDYVQDTAAVGKGRSMQIFPPDTVPSDDSIIAALLRARSRGGQVLFEPCELLEQANTFVVGGYETTNLVSSLALYYLATNPAAEARLIEEIDRVGRDTVPTYETLEQWPYAQACFKETLRLYPVAPLVARTCTQEGATLGGHRIPKGAILHFNLIAMHRDPANFPEPERFRPERFADSAAADAPDLHPAFAPFGAGPKKCIAYRMALEEGAIIIIRLFQKFRFRLSAEHHTGPLELAYGISLYPKDGIWVEEIPR